MTAPILYKATEKNFERLGLGVLNDNVQALVFEKRNDEFYLEMKYPTNGKLFHELKNDRLIKTDASQELKNQRFKIVRITKPSKGVVTVYADHVGYHSDDVQLKPEVSFSGSARLALDTWRNNLVGEHEFTTFSDIDFASSGTWSITKQKTARRALLGSAGSILDIYGGEYRFDNYHISLLQARGNDNGALISYGKNLTELEQEEQIASTYTSVYPYSILRNEEDNTEKLITLPEHYVDSEHVNNFARRKIMLLDLSEEEIKTVDALRSRTESYIKSNNVGVPSVNLRVKFIDLAKTQNYKDMKILEKIGLCDWVTIYFEKFGIRRRAKVIKTVWDCNMDRYESIELGDARAGLAESIATTVDQKLETVISTVNSVQMAADGKTKIYRGPEEPSNTTANAGDVWFKPVADGGRKMHIFNGATWELEEYNAGSLTGTINFENLNVINFIADNISGGRMNLANDLSITNGDQMVLYIDPQSGQVVANFSEIKINFKDVATKEEVDEKTKEAIDGIEFGGRNLIVTKDRNVNRYISGATDHIGLPSTSNFFVTPPIPVNNAKFITGQVTKTNSAENLRIMFLNDNLGKVAYYAAENDLVKTWAVPAGATYFVFCAQDRDGNRFQVERGSRATDIRESPEDVDERIKNIELQEGKSAFELAVEKGYTGTLEQWLASLKGATGGSGKSAYESAVEKGYTGTLDQWLDSLKGKEGAAGVSVTKTDVEFYLSGSQTALTGGTWATAAPAWQNGKYMWTRIETVFSNGTTNISDPVNVTGQKGEIGSTGPDGRSVSKLTEQYYISSSKTNLTGGAWSETRPEWKPSFYIWTRIKIDYKNPVGTEYTPAVVDASWEAIENIQIGGRNLVDDARNLSKVTGANQWKVSGNPTILHIETDSTAWVVCTIPIHAEYNSLTGDCTISFEYKNSTSNLLAFSFGAFLNTGILREITNILVDQRFKLISESNGWKRVSYTFDASSQNGIANANNYRIQIKKSSGADRIGKIEVKNIQFERGTKATDFGESQEDIQTAIVDFQFKERNLVINKNRILNRYINSTTDYKGLASGSGFFITPPAPINNAKYLTAQITVPNSAENLRIMFLDNRFEKIAYYASMDDLVMTWAVPAGATYFVFCAQDRNDNKYKVERGQQATNVSIAPEDIETEIEKVREVVTVKDTRNLNYAPSHYKANYAKYQVNERKVNTVIGAPSETTHGILISVYSENTVEQTFNAGGEIFTRIGNTQNDTWSEWKASETIEGSQDKSNAAYGRATQYALDISGNVEAAAKDYTDALVKPLKEDVDTAKDNLVELESQVISNSREWRQSFTASGGVNEIMNSVGYADLEFWKGSGNITTVQNAELETYGSGSAFILGSNSRLEQEVTGESGMRTFSVIVEKTAASSGFIEIEHDDKTELISLNSGTELKFERFELTIDTAGTNYKIRFVTDLNSEILFTNIMMNYGEERQRWGFANGEVYGATFRMNRNGFRVYQLDGKQYTAMSPDEFAGYAIVGGVWQRTFALNGETTEMNKAHIKSELRIGRVAQIYVNSGTSHGIATVRSEH